MSLHWVAWAVTAAAAQAGPLPTDDGWEEEPARSPSTQAGDAADRAATRLAEHVARTLAVQGCVSAAVFPFSEDSGSSALSGPRAAELLAHHLAQAAPTVRVMNPLEVRDRLAAEPAEAAGDAAAAASALGVDAWVQGGVEHLTDHDMVTVRIRLAPEFAVASSLATRVDWASRRAVRTRIQSTLPPPVAPAPAATPEDEPAPPPATVRRTTRFGPFGSLDQLVWDLEACGAPLGSLWGALEP